MKNILKNFFYTFSPLMVGIFVTSISLLILQPIMAMRHQKYYDIILEYVAIKGTNKSGEILAFWLSMFIGICAMFLFKFFWDKFKGSMVYSYESDIRLDFLGIGIIFIPAFFNIIMKQEVNFFLLVAGVIYYVCYLFMNKKNLKIKEVFLFLLSIYFFVLAIKAIVDKLFKSVSILNEREVYFLTMVIFISSIFYLKKRNFLGIEKIILFFQIPFPLSLLTLLTKNYSLNDKIFFINYTNRYKLLIIGIIILLIIVNIIQYKKKIKNKEKVLVMLPTIITIFILHYYLAPSYIYTEDLWHNGEQMVQWQQVVEKKMQLYKEFSSSSGLFGMISGFFQNVVLQGTDLSFFAAKSLTNVLWATSIGILVYNLVGGNFALVLSLMVGIPFYNRPTMMFVALLVLLLPRLIKSPIRWIQVYIILSIFTLFYYPLNGAALILGAFPFSLVQLYVIYKEKKLKYEIKSVTFWIMNILITYTVFRTFKILLAMIRHIRLLSSQSELADGITLYNNSKPSGWFMRFLSDDRRFTDTIWYMFIFTVIISCVLIYVYFTYIYLKGQKKQKLLTKLQSQGFLLLSSGCIALPINYTYTIIRMDWADEYARSGRTIVLFMGFLLSIFLYNYGDKLLTKNIKIISIGLCLGFSYMIQDIPLGKEIKSIERVYIVPDNYEYVDGDRINIPKLGKGFMPDYLLQYITTADEMVNKAVEKDELFWPALSREFLYIFDSKTPTKIDSMYLTKSFKSAEENLKSVINNPPALIIESVTYESYYVYRWILETGYIFYSYNGLNFWIRPDVYEKKFGNIVEARQKMHNDFPQQNLEKIPYSLGNSMSTLDKIFNNKREVKIEDLKININQMIGVSNNKFEIEEVTDPYIIINLPDIISGKDYDFIYLEISSKVKEKNVKDKKMQLYWSGDKPYSENRSIKFDYGNGKFLIPVGVNLAWNFSDIKEIRIDFDDIDSGFEFEIKSLEFLKLNTKRNGNENNE